MTSKATLPRRLAEAQACLARGANARARELVAAFANSGELEVELLLARSWFADGRPAEALRPMQAAVRIAPGNAALLDALGVVLIHCGRPAEATGVLRQAVEIDPGPASFWTNLGVAAERNADFELARRALEQAVRREPRDANARFNLAVVLERQNSTAAARDQYRAVLALAPGHVEATLNLALLAHRELDLTEAERLLRAGRAHAPAEARLYGALGNCLEDLGRFEEARSAYETARNLAPDDADARLNLAFCRLALGDWPAAWADYEARLAVARPAHAAAGVPLWHGEALDPGHLLVVAEQGFGDTLQFCRFGYELARRGVHAHLACDQRLVKIVATAGAFAAVIPFAQVPADRPQAWLPLMSLPGVLGTTLESLPHRTHYLTADPGRVTHWQRQFESVTGADRSQRLRIGIAWQGNPAAEQLTATRGRSPPLAAFAPLAQLADVVLVPLQRGAGQEQVEAVEFRDRLVLRGVALDQGPDAFADTAALMMNLDVIVTSDTAIAHLAGALGRVTWVVLKYVPDWRWLRNRSDCPWYPTVRLFRQPRAGDWTAVFTEVALAARALSDKLPPA